MSGIEEMLHLMQPLDSKIEVGLKQFAYRRASDSKALGDSPVDLTSSSGHQDLRHLNDRMRLGPRSSKAGAGWSRQLTAQAEPRGDRPACRTDSADIYDTIGYFQDGTLS